ncbi:MAG: GatB/YqeY domain-containing protein [Candidatus Binatia bacterium]
MGLKGDIQDRMKGAMKGRDRSTLSTLRLLLSAIHNEEIRERRELSTEEILKTISSLCRQRQEAIDSFQKGGRMDLAEKETLELRLLRSFLPQPLTEDEVRTLIHGSIEEVGARGIQDLGRVMKQIMPKVTGRVEGRRVNELAKEILRGSMDGGSSI